MLLRICVDRMTQELEDLFNDLETMHKSIKNAMEMIFATSPLLALQTRGWAWRSHHSTYLLRVSDGVLVSLALIEDQEDLCRPWQ